MSNKLRTRLPLYRWSNRESNILLDSCQSLANVVEQNFRTSLYICIGIWSAVNVEDIEH